MAVTKRKADEFTVLWKLLPHPPGSVVRLFSRDGDHRTGDYARTCAEMRKYAKSHEGKNCYIGPNPTCSTKGLRHTAADVTHWSYFLVDVDPVHEKACNVTKAMWKTLDWLSHWTGYDLRPESNTPPMIIDSGRGMQAWIRLADIELNDDFGHGRIIGAADAGGGSTPVISRSTARRVNGFWLKKLNEYLAMDHGCKIDTSVSDLPRVMRMPGTINMKTKRRTTLLVPSDHMFHGLAEKLTEGTPEQTFSDPAPEDVPKGQKWQKVFPYMTRMAQDYLTMGQEEPGRHKVMWHTAKKLAELGVTRDEARKALRRANSLKGKEAELPHDQVEHALKTAFEN